MVRLSRLSVCCRGTWDESWVITRRVHSGHKRALFFHPLTCCVCEGRHCYNRHNFFLSYITKAIRQLCRAFDKVIDQSQWLNDYLHAEATVKASNTPLFTGLSRLNPGKFTQFGYKKVKTNKTGVKVIGTLTYTLTVSLRQSHARPLQFCNPASAHNHKAQDREPTHYHNYL